VLGGPFGTVGGTQISHEPQNLKSGEMKKSLNKSDVFDQEQARLQEIFQKVDPDKANLVDGLIQDAAFLKAENSELRRQLEKTGMVEFHPTNPRLQRTFEAARQYLKNINSYAVIVKTLNGVLMKDVIEGEDEFDKFLRERQSNE